MTPVLIAISDRRTASAEVTLERFARLGRSARPGSVVFQLRDKELAARERLAFGRALLAVARDTEQLFVVNDRPDLAVLLGADGVHLGETSVTLADARRLLGERAFVSCAGHDPTSVGSIAADAVLLSPVLAARKGRPALGLDALRVARRARAGRERPLLFALGGIGAGEAAKCLRAGADGIAAIGSVLEAGEPTDLLQALQILR